MILGLGFVAGAMEETGIGTATDLHIKLANKVADDFTHVASTFMLVNFQIQELATIVLQNQCNLDLLTAEKGETCLFSGEECCYFTNSQK